MSNLGHGDFDAIRKPLENQLAAAQKRIGELEMALKGCHAENDVLDRLKNEADAKLARAVTLLANLLGSWSPDDWEVGVDYPALMRDAECFLDEIEKEGSK